MNIDEKFLWHLCFADDVHSSNKQQHRTTSRNDSRTKKNIWVVGIEMNLEKTKIITTEYITIEVYGQNIENVNGFMGHTLRIGRDN